MSRFARALLFSVAALAVPFSVSAQSAGDTIVVTATARVPIAQFGKQPFMRTPRISPDGTKIAMQLAKDGKGFIGIIDLSQPGVWQLS